MASAARAVFSPSRQFCAVVLDSNTLKVFDVRTGKLRNSFTPSDHLSTDLTCVAWTTAAHSNSSSKHSAEHDSLVGLGNSKGDVLVWNVVTGEVQLELRKKTAQIQGRIRHLAINSAQTHLFCCSDSSEVVEYNLQTGGLERSYSTVDGSAIGGLGRVAVSFDSTKLVAAGSKIFLWDLKQGGQQIAAFVGHASPVCALAFLPNNKHFVSADTEKFLNVWAARGATGKTPKASKRSKVKTHTKARIKLIASASVSALHVQPASSSSSSSGPVDVCAVCQNGDVDVWRLDVKKDKDATPKQPHARIECDQGDASGSSANSDSDHGGGIFALSAATSSNSTGSAPSTAAIVCARGALLQPHFGSVPVEGPDGSLKSSTLDYLDTSAILKSLRASGVGRGSVADTVVGSSASAQRGAHVLGARESASTIVGQKRRAPEEPTESGEEEDAAEEDGPLAKRPTLAEASAPDMETLEERLESLRQFTEKPAAHAADELRGDVNFGGATQSLVTILQQALQANDKAKLEYCLSVHDKEIITTTINKLPAVTILPFLRQLVDRLERAPRRGRVLVNWIRKILVRHTAYLMTVPDLAKELAALYEIIASRSALYSKVCRLSGRVDVLLAQLTHRKSLQLAATQKPLVYQDQSDDEDEDEDDDDDDDDDDELGNASQQSSDESGSDVGGLDDDDSDDDESDDE